MPKHTAASTILRQAVLLANPDIIDQDLRGRTYLQYAPGRQWT